MTSSLLEMLRASLRSRTILCVAATIILMVVAFTLLELNYRQEAAQDSAEIVTGSLPNSPPARSFELQPASAQWPPQAPSGAFMAPPLTTGPTQTLAQSTVASSTVASRTPVPLPRSRPNRR
jgi:hypothetical protein